MRATACNVFIVQTFDFPLDIPNPSNPKTASICVSHREPLLGAVLKPQSDAAVPLYNVDLHKTGTAHKPSDYNETNLASRVSYTYMFETATPHLTIQTIAKTPSP